MDSATNQRQVLATDLDGTFIPLDHADENRRDLRTISDQIARSDIELIYVTGRHPESVFAAMATYQLPQPRWLICDVGTTILQRGDDGVYRTVEAYRGRLLEQCEGLVAAQLHETFVDLAALRRQEPVKQREFKLSYYAPADSFPELRRELERRLAEQHAPYAVTMSIDPFNGDGLIDFLPRSASKAFALDWWTTQHALPAESIIYAGDSGNDTAALTAGYRAILVGNARPEVIKEVRSILRDKNLSDQLFVADRPATSGVLQGCQHFGLW